jgi:type I restriction enzyme R subunit
MQQALAYAEMLDVPFAFSSNGDGFLMHDLTGQSDIAERELNNESFPSYDELWRRYCQWKGLEDDQQKSIVAYPYHSDGSIGSPATTNASPSTVAVEGHRKGQNRLMSRLWPRALERPTPHFRSSGGSGRPSTRSASSSWPTATYSSTRPSSRLRSVGDVMHKITNRTVKRNYEIYLCLYQAVTGEAEWQQIYRQFPKDFFDLVVIDECHRGSAADDSAWREVLEYFDKRDTPRPYRHAQGANRQGPGQPAHPHRGPRVQLQLLRAPIYTYSLKQGIEDGFLAPYRVIRVVADVDALGYTPEKGKVDKHGQLVEQRVYNTKDFDRDLT